MDFDGCILEPVTDPCASAGGPTSRSQNFLLRSIRPPNRLQRSPAACADHSWAALFKQKNCCPQKRIAAFVRLVSAISLRLICSGCANRLWVDMNSRLILLTRRVLTSAAASHRSGRLGRRSRPSRPPQAGAPARKLRDTVGDGFATLHTPGAARRV